MSQASREAVAELGPPPEFNPLEEFFKHLEVEFRGIRRDRMQSIQEYKQEKGDTPRIMYARLARFARESGDAFTERQLVALYLSKQEGHIFKMVHPQLLLQYGGRATLAQAFALVEQLDNGLCVEEAGRLPTTALAKPSVPNNPQLKPKPHPKQELAGMVADEASQPNVTGLCWTCGGDHYQRDCPSFQAQPQTPGGGGGRGGRNPRGRGGGGRGGRGEARPHPSQASPGQPGAKDKCTYAPCGMTGHKEAQCWKKFPQLRPASTPSKGGGSWEARMAELQASMAQLVASSAQVTSPSARMGNASSSDLFEYGSLAQEACVATTRSGVAPTAPAKQPSVGPSDRVPKEPKVRFQGPADNIGQARLPLSFDLTDVTATLPADSGRRATSLSGDQVKEMACKLLQVPLFSVLQMQQPDFQPADVYHMAWNMAQGKEPLPSVIASNAMQTEVPTQEEERLSRERAKAATEAEVALRNWTGWRKDLLPAEDLTGVQKTESFDRPDSSAVGGAAAVYLASVSARPARERQQLKPGVVRLVNHGHVFSVSSGKRKSVFPTRVLCDTGAQPVMIGKRLADDLQITASDLEPCPFMIATSVGGTEKASGMTKEALRLQFKVGSDNYTYLSVKVVVTGALTYDILLGQQALYPIGFGHDSWTEEAWFRPGWSLGDGSREQLPVTFSNLAGLIEHGVAMFGCVGLADSLPKGEDLLEGNLSATDTPLPSEVPTLEPRAMMHKHPQDQEMPWKDAVHLTSTCQDIVQRMDKNLWSPHRDATAQKLVQLNPSHQGLVLVELFGGVATGLRAVLEAGLSVYKYVYVDNDGVARQAARHHISQLRARFGAQLPATAVQGCMSVLPSDIRLVGKEDLHRVGRVDLVMAGWPCQGHSHAGLGLGLQDPKSSLFWELLRLLRLWKQLQSTPVGYILENVLPLGSGSPEIQKDAQVVQHHLGAPISLDAAAFGSYAHRLRWKWTNLAPSKVLAAALSQVVRPQERYVDYILNKGRRSQPVRVGDRAPFAIVNKVGLARRALPTFVTYPESYAFREGGPGLVWDDTTRSVDEPSADERERAMGFPTGTTAASDLTEAQRRSLLGQAMDLNSLVYFLGICLALQRHHGSGLAPHLGAEGFGQGAESTQHGCLGEVAQSGATVWRESQEAWDQTLKEVESRDAVEWVASEDLRGQRVLAALAQDMGTKAAMEAFSRVFLGGTRPACNAEGDQTFGVLCTSGEGDNATSSD